MAQNSRRDTLNNKFFCKYTGIQQKENLCYPFFIRSFILYDNDKLEAKGVGLNFEDINSSFRELTD